MYLKVLYINKSAEILDPVCTGIVKFTKDALTVCWLGTAWQQEIAHLALLSNAIFLMQKSSIPSHSGPAGEPQAPRVPQCSVKSSHMAPELERIIRDLKSHMSPWVPLCLGVSLSLAYQPKTTTLTSKFCLTRRPQNTNVIVTESHGE